MPSSAARLRKRASGRLAAAAAVALSLALCLVVVRTDSGYGPLPTEHGTGTVVATAC
jgi:hypothetical protein